MGQVTVPEKGKKEIWKFTISNKSEKPLNYNFFCFFPFINDGPMGGEVKLSKNQKCVYKFAFPYHVFYEEKAKAENNHGYTYIVANKKIHSFDGNAWSFYGNDNLETVPIAVKNGKCSNCKGQGDFLDAAIQITGILGVNGTEDLVLEIGVADTYEQIETISNYVPEFDIALDEARQYRKTHFTGYEIETPIKELNHFLNIWLPKQVTYLTRLNRGGVYCPVRNQLQDALGYSMIDPYGALEFALKVLRRQKKNGYLKQWYNTDGSPDVKLCKLNHSDACIWLVLCITEIINNCGDIDIFSREEPFVDSEDAESVLSHLKKAIYSMYSNIGEHGLCLMLDGDWTDPINGAGRLGRGESVWNSMALIYAIKVLTNIFPDDKLSKIAEELKTNINKYCWDGKWYIAGFDDFGKPFGTDKDEEGKLFLNTQTWAFISDVVPKDREKVLLKSIESLEVPFGWLLLDKPFSKWNDVWGRISIKQKGTTENGSVYCHATMFKALADCVRGDRDSALDAVLKTLPTNPQNPVSTNLQLPLYVPNYYFGIENENFGKSSCYYSTGTTAWLIWVTIKHIIGIDTSILGIEKKGTSPKKLLGSHIDISFKGKKYSFNI